jgi:ribosome biogenesis protein BMS1
VSEEEDNSGEEKMEDEEKEEKDKKWIQIDAPEAKKEKEQTDEAVKEYIKPEAGMHAKGRYVKIDTMIENKYLDQFNPQFPIVVCGFDQQEGTMTYLRARVKKHRWYPKILKTFDPLIISIGWRRFQTIFTYTVEESNTRQRVIKYTPKFDFCQTIFYGPSLPLHTAFLGIQTLAEDVSHFRVAATGDVMELGQNFPVVKKLKLVGEPLKVYKNTAFIKGMFNSKVRTIVIIMLD